MGFLFVGIFTYKGLVFLQQNKINRCVYIWASEHLVRIFIYKWIRIDELALSKALQGNPFKII
ncbi:hypothetical protein C1H71_12285 [Iodobacter fluviatilis]|uniref:Uncharacterized protein n=1 Tax=Iodobacter fluviatilis TaxID=537 RepID=A0A7G3GB08_9NEIS|nr:hypothetical protein C1H71_12285 [Iodobacter fluviatilis]